MSGAIFDVIMATSATIAGDFGN